MRPSPEHPSSSVRVGIVQMDIALGQPEANRAKAAAQVRAAAAAGARITVLPELWPSGYDLAHLDRLGEGRNGPTCTLMSNLAAETGCYIMGSWAEAEASSIYNTLHVVAPTGHTLARYRKVHLFPPMREDVYFRAGGETVTVPLPWGTLGLALCYDLRFPELFRKLALEGAELFAVPAEWPELRLNHWRLLAQARAIENQAYFVGCNRVGADADNVYPGHSIIVDPLGEVLAEGDSEESLVLADLDLGKVRSLRSKFPSLNHRRPEVYEWTLAAARNGGDEL